ncbi:hypothetical protein [Jeotgalicoccus sp. WY2]|uniref:hypothetical protein n=1 Tax=Jeotgalicoccus sp. WY2 TaxID=2708346 RepID=UPI001BD24FE3|nr:hypothetical protein [Jeotgalicoccus sp. WY2]
MNLIKSLIPELVYCTGAVIVFITMWNIMSFVYAMFFLGALLFIVAGYLDSVMRSEKRA